MSNLPKGVILNHGYIQVRIMHNGEYYHKNFKKDSPLARELASIHASEKYKEILLGTFGITREKPMKFKEARLLFLKRHYTDYRDPETNKGRSKKSIANATSLLEVVGFEFDNMYLHEIELHHIKAYKTKRLKVLMNGSFNRERGMLLSLFSCIKLWIKEKEISPIKLPVDNPCAGIPTMEEVGRERIPDTWELVEAYKWCQTNDPGFWDGIENGLLTALRKGDLVALDGSLTVKGIQQKTGEKFDLPIKLKRPTNLHNFQRRWGALRLAMGWLKFKDEARTLLNPKHTTWHDLRHWAPTLLGENGFSIKIIQSYGGWSTEAMAEKYTNVRRKALEPAVKTIKEALAQIKEQQ